MSPKKYIPDTCVISPILFPRANQEIADWFIEFSRANASNIYLSDIVAYEVTRGLYYKKFIDPNFKGLERFQKIKPSFKSLSLTSIDVEHAARLWAQAKAKGSSTDSEMSLDNDVLLAAQAIQLEGVVITENLSHFERYCDAMHWKDLLVSEKYPLIRV